MAGDPDPKADHPTVDDGVAGLAFIANRGAWLHGQLKPKPEAND